MLAAPSRCNGRKVRLYRMVFTVYSRSFGSSGASGTGQFQRSDFANQPFTGYYEPHQPTVGPLADIPVFGPPHITPRALKQHLDQYVVGQERAKKVLSVAVYNHYQRIQETSRRGEEEQDARARERGRHMSKRHTAEDDLSPSRRHGDSPSSGSLYPPALEEQTLCAIEKSNILLLGPSGVGKTLMAKTLARILEVPFSMSDCTPLTQAGYIGEDAEICIQRLLVAANYDVARAESGIVCLDEIDKIASAKVSHGKDVGGEGVQQALLKIIEGTTVQVQAKPDRAGPAGRSPSNSSSGGPAGGPAQGNAHAKAETYSIRTENILFICTGAFIGLQKFILDRIERGSLGFGANVRRSQPDPSSADGLLADQELFLKHLPYFYSSPVGPPSSSSSSACGDAGAPAKGYNILDLVEPTDLRKYGMIAELVGRLPVACALSALDEDALVRVLTEPRNSLLRQYEQLFHLSGVELRVTTPALRGIAKAAQAIGTGARGLRTILERLLGEAMFETPGSHIKHVLVTERAVLKQAAPMYFLRGQQHRFHQAIAAEEEQWTHSHAQTTDGPAADHGLDGNSFEQYRVKQGGSSSG